jgi:hypothetical protein
VTDKVLERLATLLTRNVSHAGELTGFILVTVHEHGLLYAADLSESDEEAIELADEIADLMEDAEPETVH